MLELIQATCTTYCILMSSRLRRPYGTLTEKHRLLCPAPAVFILPDKRCHGLNAIYIYCAASLSRQHISAAAMMSPRRAGCKKVPFPHITIWQSGPARRLHNAFVLLCLLAPAVRFHYGALHTYLPRSSSSLEGFCSSQRVAIYPRPESGQVQIIPALS